MAKFSWQRYFELWEKKKVHTHTKKKNTKSIHSTNIFYVSFKEYYIYVTLNGKTKKKIFEKYVFDLATIGMMTDDTNFICLHRQRILLLLNESGECTKQLLKMLGKLVYYCYIIPLSTKRHIIAFHILKAFGTH